MRRPRDHSEGLTAAQITAHSPPISLAGPHETLAVMLRRLRAFTASMLGVSLSGPGVFIHCRLSRERAVGALALPDRFSMCALPIRTIKGRLSIAGWLSRRIAVRNTTTCKVRCDVPRNIWRFVVSVTAHRSRRNALLFAITAAAFDKRFFLPGKVWA
jgi:hypothetical protein